MHCLERRSMTTRMAVKLEDCLGTIGYGQPRLTKTCTRWASRSSADLWPVAIGYGWAEV
ncbi:hypothetical protein PAXRUDRAFT_835305 [Paxillus rubicundulus Ve08.2h10]|uniref:Uncharacterized protein n=1 Tax=Paxillus rubicundulus Ve08.2h10 TaxID=930991 RepID=A0A0D0BZU0_9AGAM|nr:hypothetical protein PAXRUDRAFT_835305 [Paxillus rubicundulus Ve08.2h10]